MRLSKLTTVIASSVFILVVGMMLNIAILYWMAGVLLSLPAVGWAYAIIQSRGIAVRRRMPAVGRVGETVSVQLEARNETLLPKLQVWLEDSLPPGMTAEQRPEVGLHLPPKATARGSYSVQLQRRGRHQIQDTRLVSIDPLGLSATALQAPAEGEILVYPRIVPLPPDCLPIGADNGLAREDTAHRRGEGATFRGIREYQPGDPLRRVHWRSSARWGRLSVMEFEDERSCDLVLALETLKPNGNGKGIDAAFEFAVSLAASLAALAVERGHGVQLVTPARATGSTPANDRRPPHERGPEGLSAILEVLAGVEADSDVSLADELPHHAPELSPGSSLVWITTTADPDLVASARSLTAARLDVTILAVDAASFHGKPGDPAEWARVADHLARAHCRFGLFRKGDSMARVLEMVWRGSA